MSQANRGDVDIYFENEHSELGGKKKRHTPLFSTQPQNTEELVSKFSDINLVSTPLIGASSGVDAFSSVSPTQETTIPELIATGILEPNLRYEPLLLRDVFRFPVVLKIFKSFKPLFMLEDLDKYTPTELVDELNQFQAFIGTDNTKWTEIAVSLSSEPNKIDERFVKSLARVKSTKLNEANNVLDKAVQIKALMESKVEKKLLSSEKYKECQNLLTDLAKILPKTTVV